MVTNSDSEIDELCDRAAQYQVLASFFMDLPSLEHIRTMKEQLKEAQDSESEGLRELAAFFSEMNEVDKHMVEKIAADRTYLIRGTTKKGPRPPYGSLYAGSDPGSSMLALKARYRKAGIELASETHEAPDYLGVELAFMADLLRRSAAAAEEERQHLLAIGNEFLSEVLSSLACSYIQEALVFARTGYCRGMLLLLREFMESERAAAEG